MKTFVFLICTERSGSNLITSIMNGHSRISGPPPTHLFRMFVTNRANYGDLDKEPNWNALVDDMVFSYNRKLGYWLTDIDADELKRGVLTRTEGALLRSIYEKEAKQDQADVIFVKENHTYAFARQLLDQFPSCRFVFMTRDPRDVASSWVRTDSIAGGVEKAIDTWANDQKQSLAFFEQFSDQGYVSHVRYEDLVQHPESTLEELTSFLGVTYEREMMTFNRSTRTQINAERIDAWENLGKPIIRGNTGKYLKVLSQNDRLYIELRCHELMAKLGYTCELLDANMMSKRDAILAELRPTLSKGQYRVSSESESNIRALRREAIARVLSRRL